MDDGQPADGRTWRGLALVGGDAALDFVNTVAGTTKGRDDDALTDFDALAEWAEAAGLSDANEAALMRAEAAAAPGPAVIALTRARATREALHRLFGRIAAGGVPTLADRGAFETEAQEARRAGRLAVDVGRRSVRWEVKVEAAPLDAVRHGWRSPPRPCCRAGARPRPRMRGLFVAVRRPLEERPPPLVFHGGVRQPRQGAAPSSADIGALAAAQSTT